MDFKEFIGKEVVVEFGDWKEGGYPFQKGVLTYIDENLVILKFKGKRNLIKDWIKVREVNE